MEKGKFGKEIFSQEKENRENLLSEEGRATRKQIKKKKRDSKIGRKGEAVEWDNLMFTIEGKHIKKYHGEIMRLVPRTGMKGG